MYTSKEDRYNTLTKTDITKFVFKSNTPSVVQVSGVDKQ